MAIPQTQDLTDTRAIRCDFGRKPKIEDDKHRQPAAGACVVFNKDEKRGDKNRTRKKTVQAL